MSVTLSGIPASSGVAIGPYVLYDPTTPVIPHDTITTDEVAQERARLNQALQAASVELTQLRDQVQQRLGNEEAAIFDAHLLMLEDEALLDGAYQRIERDLQNATWAFWDAAEEFVRMLADLEDPYFRARATDIYDVRTRVVNHLLNKPTAELRYLDTPVIVVARDLLPSDTAGFDPALILGLVTELGGPTSHTAILARQLALPAVVGVEGLFASFQNDDHSSHRIALNGNTGEIVLEPDEAIVQSFQQAQQAYRERKQQLQSLVNLPATTPDNVTVEVAANIGRLSDAQPALEAGAGGVGLFRTEFLFLEGEAAPTENEQREVYRTVLQTFAGKTVIVRTLDIGGDKSIAYLDLPKENNPFLGLRGLRLCLAKEYQPLFRTQLRALLLATQDAQASSVSLWIMFPMVCDLRELRQAKAFLAETEEMLLQEGALQASVRQHISIGIMIETPAAALLVDQLAQEADFFSIGTNDLAQYTLASDRMNARLAELHRPFHPAVMRSIAHIVSTAQRLQRWVGMCGEMAGDARAAAFLLGLGINELSMEANSLNAVKQVMRATSFNAAQELVQQVLALESSEEIERFLAQHI
jgi:phosphoenolpyruvate-protein phosphotransferase (PTS system enzyme I)